MTQKKIVPKKAAKCAQRVERVERSSSEDNKKRARSPSDEEEEESDRKERTKRTQRVERVERSSPKNTKKRADRILIIMKKKVTNRIEKREEVTEIGSPIQPKKLRRRNEKRPKGRFSSKSVDFFTNILLIEIMTANPLRLPRKESRR